MPNTVQTIVGKILASAQKLTSTIATATYNSKIASSIEVVGKTKAVVAKTSELVVVAVQTSKIKLLEAVQTGKTAVSFTLGDFLTFIRPYFNNSFTVSDLLGKIFGKGVVDQVNTTDTVDSSVTKVSTDSLNLSDELSRTVEFNRDYTDSTQVGDSLRFAEFTKESGDSFNISDSFARTVVFTRDLLDTVNITDDINGAAVDDDQNVTFFKNTQNSVNFGETLGFENTFSREFVDSFNISQVFSYTFTKAVTPDQFTVGDTQYSEVVKTSSDNFNISDSLSSTVEFFRDFTHQVNFSEDRRTVFEKAALDSFNISDSVYTFTLIKELDSAVTVTDDINGAAIDDDQTVTFFKNTINLVNFNSVVEFVNTFTRDVDETANVSETVSTGVVKNPPEYINVSESVEANYTLTRSNIVNISEDYSRLVEFNRDIVDGLLLSEILSSTLNKDYPDYINISDIIDILKETIYGVSDSYNIGEQAVFNFTKTNAETINISEQDEVVFVKGLQHSINLSEVFSVTATFTREFTDAVNITDDINGAAVDDDQTVTFFKNTSHSVNFGDLPINQITKQPLDTANISSTGKILTQGYTNSGDYFLEDYVGTSRTIA